MENTIKRSRVLYNDVKDVSNYQELVNYATTKYAENIAYKYKENPTSKEIVEKTYAQVGKDVKAFSTALLNRGFEGKKVIVIGANRYEWCITYLAATCGGMLIIPLDKALPEKEIMNLIRRSEADVAVFDKKYMDIFIKAKNDKELNLHTLICSEKMEKEEQKDDVLAWNNILEEGKKQLKNGDQKYEKIEIDSNKMSIILFTSGTTSEPKGVMLSQNNICSNITNIAKYVRIYSTDTLLSFLPLHHTFESTITFLYGFYSGATIAFCDGLRYIQPNLKEYKVSVFVAVPLVLETMYKKIQKGIDDQGKTKLINIMVKLSNALLKAHIDIRKFVFKPILENFGGKLRVVLYGAAPMDKNTIIGYNNLGIALIQGYGLTETSPVVTAETDKEKRPGSIGLPLNSLDVRIANPDKDGVGEIEVKGPSVMLGYYQNEKKTNEVLKDGWFSTGDFGYIDKDGFIYVTGRKNDIIVLRNGKNVYPSEIEFLINKVSYINESMVFSRGENNTDTMLCAKIVYDKEIIESEHPGEDYEKVIWKEIKEINKELPTYKHIKKIIVTDIPMEKTTTQKIKRNLEISKIK